ncbi:MAG TPA: hypothetical protein VGP69_07150 [Gaiellaceae bacterium]|jgi:hypothetical protein|nr:hypothetical protein [Gaiellaceae bacterium]
MTTPNTPELPPEPQPPPDEGTLPLPDPVPELWPPPDELDPPTLPSPDDA